MNCSLRLAVALVLAIESRRDGRGCRYLQHLTRDEWQNRHRCSLGEADMAVKLQPNHARREQNNLTDQGGEDCGTKAAGQDLARCLHLKDLSTKKCGEGVGH